MDGSIAETRGCVDGIMSHGSEGCLPVHYTCGCRRGGRLEHLFFCYECDEARCGGKCTVDELVSFYCPRCLQNFMSREALDNGNRCVPLTVVPARRAPMQFRVVSCCAVFMWAGVQIASSVRAAQLVWRFATSWSEGVVRRCCRRVPSPHPLRKRRATQRRHTR